MRQHTFRRAANVALLSVLMLAAWGLGPAGASSSTAQVGASPSAAQVGSWSDPMPLGIVGVHAALLPTGKVLYYELPGATLSRARVFDPLTGVSTVADPHLAWSVFCSGLSFMADGRVFATGGEPPRTPANPVGTGIQNDAFFDPVTQTWSGGPPMRFARWYPSNVDMPDGTVLVMGGERVPVNGNTSNLVRPMESFDPTTDRWTTLPTTADITGLYPRGMLLPNGHVLVSGPQRTTKEFDPATERWSSISSMIYGNRDGGGVVLLPGLQRVLTSGGYGANEVATRTAEILNLSAPNPHWTSTGSMAIARAHQNMVLLPDGTVLAVGGGQLGNFDDPVKTSELYDPSTGTWSTMATQAAPRSYHSTALLLPDGRVISAGSNSGTSFEDTVEIYSPPYLFKGPRPSIASAPATIGFGGSFEVQTPDADSVTRVALMRLGATTHGWAQEQRYVDLDFTRGNGVLHVSGPTDAAEATAGPYMLFILDGNGVPSVASIMSLSSSAITHTLTVSPGGTGTGSVTSDLGGIACPTTCSATDLAHNMHVILTAVPDPGSAFAGWGGGCDGTVPTCEVTMDADHAITATFEPAVALSVALAGAGSGTVRAPPNDEIDCPPTCTGSFAEHASVTLGALAGEDSIFTGWSGDCSGTGSCTVTMDVMRNVTATFGPAWALHVDQTGAGEGTVTSDVGGINCGDRCDVGFQDGTPVTLHAAADGNSVFTGWTGDVGGGCLDIGDCVVTMDQARTVTAHYDPILHQVAVATAGTGTGMVTSLTPSPGIDCGATCDASFQQGSTVILRAAADEGSIFTGWSGDIEGDSEGGGGCVDTGDCTVTVDMARSIVATFEPGWVLDVARDGARAGTVVSTPSGIDCGAVCNDGFLEGTVVTLHAADGPNSTFGSWSGDTDGACPGTADCVVTVDQARSITAHYDPITWQLDVTKIDGTGTGTVTSLAPNLGIDCGETCTSSYQQGDYVLLHAEPDPGSDFTGWSGGGCSGTADCAVTIDAAKSVGAQFELAHRLLTVTKAGNGAGSVTSDSGGIDCPVACGATYPQGAIVALTANLGANSVFSGWSGACSGTGTCSVTMDVARNVTATFTPIQNSLTVTKLGAGTGTITSDLAGINCGATCSANYDYGAPVMLSATATDGSTFAGWSGAACSGTGTCIVIMSFATSITATFNPPVPGTVLKDNDPAVAYNGWSGVIDPAANGGYHRMSNVKNDSATWKSTATTSITWVTRTGPDQGKASVTIDGVNEGTLDLYSAVPAVLNKVYTGLAKKVHTVVINVLHAKNPSSTGFNVRLDAFVVGAATTQESDPKIQYDTWNSSAQALATNATYRSTTNNKALVTVTFTGTSIDWITVKGKAYGKASVKIDGLNKGTIDLYKAATTWQSLVSFNGLSAGPHTMVIQVLGLKSAPATGTKVVVDGFIVHT